MKRIILSIIILGSAFSFSSCKTSKQATQSTGTQVPENVQLTNGQKITFTSITSSDADMGMGMGMKNSSTATNVFNVIQVTDSSYSVSNTMTKMKMSMEVMGQQTNYDSEKPEDKESEIGKGISAKLNQTDTFSVNKITGRVTKPERTLSPEKADDNPLMGMMSAMGISAGSDPSLQGAFFTAAKNKKAGDSWTDSSMVKSIKTIKNYTLKSIENDVATVETNGTTNGTGETEMQGNSVSFTMNSKSKGLMTVDIKKGLVIKITDDADLTMTLDVMGQSMPINSKTTTTMLYQY